MKWLITAAVAALLIATTSTKAITQENDDHRYPGGGLLFGSPFVPVQNTKQFRVKRSKVYKKSRSSRSTGLVKIKFGPKHTIMVAATAAIQFEGFGNELSKHYDFSKCDVGGYAKRSGKCHVGSKHPCGGAVDVCQVGRSRGPGHLLPKDFPVALTEQIADKWGLFPGSRWTCPKHGSCVGRGPDVGHFETKSSLAGANWKPGVQLADVDPVQPKHPLLGSIQVASADIDIPISQPIIHVPEIVPLVITDRSDDLMAKFQVASFAAESALYSIHSELPPKEKPVIAVKRALKDVPEGTPYQEVSLMAKLFALPHKFFHAIARIENDYHPTKCTGSFCGIFQLGIGYAPTWTKWGWLGGNVKSARDNSLAAASKFATEREMFRASYGREPEDWEMYMTHQQGWGGFEEHSKRPDRTAWKSMCATEDGPRYGEKWCKNTVRWNYCGKKNTQCYSTADAMTSGEFMEHWKTRYAKMEAAVDTYKPPVYSDWKPKKKRYAKRHKRVRLASK